VTVTTINRPKDGWTGEQAIDLVRQGYTVDRVGKVTGFAPGWLRSQPRPSRSLAARAMARKLRLSQPG
jgi:hypothetical protein